MNDDRNKSVFERGRIRPCRELNGHWSLEDADDDSYEVIPGRLPVRENRFLTEDEARTVCNVFNDYRKLKGEFTGALDAIREMLVVAKEDAIPEEGHVAVDLVLKLIDSKVKEFTWKEAT